MDALTRLAKTGGVENHGDSAPEATDKLNAWADALELAVADLEAVAATLGSAANEDAAAFAASVHAHAIVNVTGLQAALDGKSATGHAHAISDTTGLQTALDAKADLVGGVLPTAQLPAIAITEYLGSVASQVAMLALPGQYGDWCIRSDVGAVYVIVGADPSILAGWQALEYPAAPVTSVNSQTGAVTLGYADVGAASAAQGATADAAVPKALFDAYTILAATSDNTPAALTVAEQTLVGRITGGAIAALTAPQIRTLLNVADGADALAASTLWQAAGDIVVGTGSGTAARLAKGSALQQIRMDAGGTAIEWFTPSASGDFRADGTVDMTGEFRTDVGTFDSDVANGASAIGYTYDTQNSFSTSGAKLVSWKNAGSEKLYIDKDGILASTSGRYLQLGNPISLIGDGAVNITGTSTVTLKPSSTGNASFAVKRVGAASVGSGSEMKLDSHYSNDIVIGHLTPATDVGLGKLTIRAITALTSASTNIVGGLLALEAGNGASASGGNAHGGNILITPGTGYGTGHHGYIVLAHVPTSDPGISGALYSTAGALMISA